MARPKAFDPDRAVDAAMQTFWRCGYEGTSIDALTAACGIGRGSLYGTFGSKDALYLRSLERYQHTEGERARACLDGEGSVRERIARLFARFADDALEDPDNRGCFVLNAAAERAPHDPETARRVRAGIGQFERALTDLLRDGDYAEPRRLARFLVAALNGVRITAKATQDRALVDDAIVVALRALE